MDGRKDLNVLVGANIKRERERAGFTQDRFSELLGIGSKSLSSIERGVVGVSLSTLLRICDILIFPQICCSMSRVRRMMWTVSHSS